MGTWRIHGGDGGTGLTRWQDGLAAAFVRLDAEQRGGGDFTGSIRQTRLPGGEVSRVTATAHRVVRRRTHITEAPRDVVFANLQISGRGEINLPGAPQRTAPMDLGVVHSAERYAIAHDGPFELISFALPLDDLPRGLGMGVTPLSRSGAGRELAGVLAGLAALAERLPEAGAALEGQIRQTLGLAARLAPTRGADDAEVLRAAIAAHIARRHGDPGLSAAPLAAAFGLDPRRLHALFEGTGRSVGARIEAARLAAAARLLEETDLPVSQVARRAGFRDPAYMSRVFRRRHGASPRDWRAARSS